MKKSVEASLQTLGGKVDKKVDSMYYEQCTIM